MVFSGESFFLRCCDQFPVLEKTGSRIMVESGNAKNQSHVKRTVVRLSQDQKTFHLESKLITLKSIMKALVVKKTANVHGGIKHEKSHKTEKKSLHVCSPGLPNHPAVQVRL